MQKKKNVTQEIVARCYLLLDTGGIERKPKINRVRTMIRLCFIHFCTSGTARSLLHFVLYYCLSILDYFAFPSAASSA
jgi:hypothetical protein